MSFDALVHWLDSQRIYLLDRRFVAKTCVLCNDLHNTRLIQLDFDIYIDVLGEFDFELDYGIEMLMS